MNGVIALISENLVVHADLNTNVLEEKIIKWGATIVGFGDVRTGLAKEFRHMPTAISLGIKHPPRHGAEGSGPEDPYIHFYPDLDRTLEEIQKRVVKRLRSLGWRALAIPPYSDKIDARFIAKLYPLFPHKTAATCSGLGWIGKNGLLVNPQYGSRLSWATILTDAPLAVNPHPIYASRCGACRRCVDACPAGALLDVKWSRRKPNQGLVDMEACRRQLAKNHREKGIFACGQCVLACNKGSSCHPLPFTNTSCNADQKEETIWS